MSFSNMLVEINGTEKMMNLLNQQEQVSCLADNLEIQKTKSLKIINFGMRNNSRIVLVSLNGNRSNENCSQTTKSTLKNQKPEQSVDYVNE